MYDAHTHLNSPQLFPDREKHLDDFIVQGGKGLVNVGSDHQYNKQALEIASQFAAHPKKDFFLGTALGYHPFEIAKELENKKAEEIKDDIKMWIEELKKQYKNHSESLVAVGEGGIDLHYGENDNESISLQKELFGLHCDLAQELNLPLIIHSRDGFDETLDVVKNYKDLTIYFHCWSYGPEELKTLQKIFPNLFVGFCCNTMYPKAQNLRDSLQVVDRERLLLETDAPYLPPQQFRGQINYPVYIDYLYEYVSNIFDQKRESLIQQIGNNFNALYIR